MPCEEFHNPVVEQAINTLYFHASDTGRIYIFTPLQATNVMHSMQHQSAIRTYI